MSYDRLEKVREVEEYRLLSEGIFSVQGGLLDAEHFIINVESLQ